jgi:hypothetical protein
MELMVLGAWICLNIKINFFCQLKCRIFSVNKKNQKKFTINDMAIEISDHQQSWGYEEGPWKGPGSAGGH